VVATPKRKTIPIAKTIAMLRKTDRILVTTLTKLRSLTPAQIVGKAELLDRIYKIFRMYMLILKNLVNPVYFSSIEIKNPSVPSRCGHVLIVFNTFESMLSITSSFSSRSTEQVE